MYYTEIEPDPDLKPWIAAYWLFRVESGAPVIDHWIPLTGGAMVSFGLGLPAILTGPRIEPFSTQVRGGDRFWGVHFWPGTVRRFLGLCDRSLRDTQLPLSAVVSDSWPDVLARKLALIEDEAEAANALDRFLVSLDGGREPLDELVMTAAFRLIASRGERPIAGLAEELGLSARQLRRRFKRTVELTPKELARINRMRSSAVDAVSSKGERWVDIAAAHGYSDQPHLVREFRRILGLTPIAFDAHMDRIEHGRIVR